MGGFHRMLMLKTFPCRGHGIPTASYIKQEDEIQGMLCLPLDVMRLDPFLSKW